MATRLNSESRPDIAAGISAKIMLGGANLVFPKIFPVHPVKDKGGNLYVATDITGSATSNRSYGNALSGTHIAASSVSYSCGKIEKRSELEDADIKDLGGVDPAVAAGARVSARAVALAMESAAAALVIDSTRYSAAATINAKSPFAALMKAATAVKAYGRPYLVCSESWLNDFVSIPEVAVTLRGLFGDRVITDVVSGVETVLAAVGSHFGCKGIIVGDDAAWKVSEKTDAAAVVAIRDGDGDAYLNAKMAPAFGLTPVFLPDPAAPDAPFEIDTGWDNSTKVNTVDATIFAVSKVLNVGGAVVVKLPAVLDPPVTVQNATVGAVTCTITGDGGSGKWKVSGETDWLDSGEYAFLAAGTYTITFKSVASKTAPDDITSVVVNAAAVTTKSGEYTAA